MSNVPKEHFWGLGAHLEYSLRYVSRSCDISFENSMLGYIHSFIAKTMLFIVFHIHRVLQVFNFVRHSLFFCILFSLDQIKVKFVSKGYPSILKLWCHGPFFPVSQKTTNQTNSKGFKHNKNLIQNLCRPVIHKVIDREKTDRCCHTSLWFQCGYDFYYF